MSQKRFAGNLAIMGIWAALAMGSGSSQAQAQGLLYTGSGSFTPAIPLGGRGGYGMSYPIGGSRRPTYRSSPYYTSLQNPLPFTYYSPQSGYSYGPQTGLPYEPTALPGSRWSTRSDLAVGATRRYSQGLSPAIAQRVSRFQGDRFHSDGSVPAIAQRRVNLPVDAPRDPAATAVVAKEAPKETTTPAAITPPTTAPASVSEPVVPTKP